MESRASCRRSANRFAQKPIRCPEHLSPTEPLCSNDCTNQQNSMNESLTRICSGAHDQQHVRAMVATARILNPVLRVATLGLARLTLCSACLAGQGSTGPLNRIQNRAGGPHAGCGAPNGRSRAQCLNKLWPLQCNIPCGPGPVTRSECIDQRGPSAG